MKEIYKKHIVNIEYINEEYKYWKLSETRINAFLEAYKNKWAICFQVENLLPSSLVTSGSKGYYNFLLIGNLDGKIVHNDFGKFYVDRNGIGTLYIKFTDEPYYCYTDCVLMVNKKESCEYVIKGTMPYKKEETKYEEKEEGPWEKIFKQAMKEEGRQLFAESIDETNALWNIVSFDGNNYGHIVVGENKDGERFVGVPGRFLLEEQPEMDGKKFELWQPLRGGEEFFDKIENMDSKTAEYIYGYWIAEIDGEGTLKNV